MIYSDLRYGRCEVYMGVTALGYNPWVNYSLIYLRELRNYPIASSTTPAGGLLVIF